MKAKNLKQKISSHLERAGGSMELQALVKQIVKENPDVKDHAIRIVVGQGFPTFKGKVYTTKFFEKQRTLEQTNPTTSQTPNGIRHIAIDYEKFIPNGLESYIAQGSEDVDLLKILKTGKPVLLTGIKGIGKSLLAATTAKQLGIPRFIFNCSLSSSEDDIIGYYADLGLFADGIVTQAVRCALERGEAMLVLEEVNSLQPGVAMALHSLLDFNKTLTIKPTGEIYRVNGSGKLYIVATANIGYEGTLPMNPAFKSRFVQMHLDMPKKSVLVKIASQHTAEEIAEAMASIVLGLQRAASRGELRDYPSVREMVTACKLYSAFEDFTKAVTYAFLSEYLYSPTETSLVKNIIQSSSPIPLEWK